MAWQLGKGKAYASMQRDRLSATLTYHLDRQVMKFAVLGQQFIWADIFAICCNINQLVLLWVEGMLHH